jgi:hypothetical protein
MKFCIKCAEELLDDAKFCSKCGVKQESAAHNEEKQPKPEAAAEPPQQEAPVNMASAISGLLGALLGLCGSSPPSETEKTWTDRVREVYERTPQEANYKKCKKANQCGCNNCYGFAMKVAAGKMDLDECPYHE